MLLFQWEIVCIFCGSPPPSQFLPIILANHIYLKLSPHAALFTLACLRQISDQKLVFILRAVDLFQLGHKERGVEVKEKKKTTESMIKSLDKGMTVLCRS